MRLSFARRRPPQPLLAKSNWGHKVNAVAAFFSRLTASGRTLRQPSRDPRDRFAHVIGRARVAEANVAMSMDRVEVDAGRRCDVRLFQHLFGEVETVGSEF